MSVQWEYEKTKAEIGRCRVEIRRHQEEYSTSNGWAWFIDHPHGTAQGTCQSFELAQERVVKIAEFFNKEMR